MVKQSVPQLLAERIESSPEDTAFLRKLDQSWQEISPDLTTNDESKLGISGGLTPDNIGVEYCCVIYAFDESPVQPCAMGRDE